MEKVAFDVKAPVSLKRGKIGRHQGYYCGPIGSHIRSFDQCQNRRPWMTSKGHYALCFKTRTPWCCQLQYLFLVSRSVCF